MQIKEDPLRRVGDMSIRLRGSRLLDCSIAVRCSGLLQTSFTPASVEHSFRKARSLRVEMRCLSRVSEDDRRVKVPDSIACKKTNGLASRILS